MARTARRASGWLGVIEQSLLVLSRHVDGWVADADADARTPAAGLKAARGARVTAGQLRELRAAAKRPLNLPGGRTAPALIPTLRALNEATPQRGGQRSYELLHALCRKVNGALVDAPVVPMADG